MENIITGKNIVKTFGTGNEQVKALDSVDAEVKRGEFVAVMGPSGSGKTTLLHTLSGMDSITSGSVKFKDAELSGLSENALADVRRTKMGFIFQQPTMLKNLNLLDNIILPAAWGGRRASVKLMHKAKDLMKIMGIDGLEYGDVTEVSGGQLQRAGICRALMNDPRILFGDEPTGALNSKSAQEIMDIFTEINAQGTAVMLVTHDARIAARTERVLFLCDGRIVREAHFPKYTGKDMEQRMEKIMELMKEAGI